MEVRLSKATDSLEGILLKIISVVCRVMIRYCDDNSFQIQEHNNAIIFFFKIFFLILIFFLIRFFVSKIFFLDFIYNTLVKIQYKIL